MVCLRGDRIESVAIAEAIGSMKGVDPKSEIVAAARAIGISFGD
jgi:hypothetical protein